jgi:hypothetical protein
MKVNYRLFIGLALFYVLMTGVYYYVGGEPVGIACLALSALLAAMVGYYVWFTDHRIGSTLPEDNLQGEIADSAGELGFYSPHSWWPLPVAASMFAAGLGLIIGWWLTLLAIGSLIVSIIGFVTEYEKPINEVTHH